jgi:hypothetical protein
MTPVCRQREGFDVLLGNPPFLNQVENATTVEKGLASVARIVNGGSAVRYTDVSAMFLLLSRNLLADHGRVALVQPQSLLAAKAAGPVRSELLSDSSLVSIWVSNEHLFSASVFTCAPTLLKSGPRRVALERQHSAGFTGLPPLEVEMDELSQEVSWAHLTAEASGIPSVHIVSGGTLGDLADTVADFTEYYRLEGFIVDDAELPDGADRKDFPPLVTTGLVDLAVCSWGHQPTRILKQRWQAPRVDRRRMYAEGTLGPWIDRRRVPKVILATQTKVIEVFVDEPGEYIASIPLITVMPNDVVRVWHIAAALASPVTCALALRHFAGAALSAEAIKLSAKQTLALPIPMDRPEWDTAAALLKEAHTLADEESRAQRLLDYARASVAAFGVPEEQAAGLLEWWSVRFGTATELEEAADAE